MKELLPPAQQFLTAAIPTASGCPLNVWWVAADAPSMIRLRFVALLGAFALLLGGYGTYVARSSDRPRPSTAPPTRPTSQRSRHSLPPCRARRDDARPVRHMVRRSRRRLLDQHHPATESIGFRVDEAARRPGRQGPDPDECLKPDTRPIVAPDGGCVATIDYHGSRIDLSASSAGKSDNGGRTFLRVDSLLVTPSGSSLGGRHSVPGPRSTHCL